MCKRANIMRLFFVFFILFLFLLPGLPEASICSGNEKDVSKRKNETFSSPPAVRKIPSRTRFFYIEPERATASQVFASRTRFLLRNIFQNRNSSSMPYSIVADKKAWQKTADLLQVKEAPARLMITIPGDFFLLYMYKEALYKIVSLALLAEAGVPLQKEEDFRKSFLVAAIVHEALNHIFLAAMPYSKYDPFSSTLASYGLFPTLKMLLAYPPHPASPEAGIYEEYSAHLLSFLLRGRFFSGGDFLSVVREMAQKGVSGQYRILSEKITEKLQKSKKQQEDDADGWFQQNMKKFLLSSLMPASPHYIEKEYIKHAVLSGMDHSGKMQKYTLRQYTKAVKELSNPDYSTYRILQFLLRHARIAPGDSRNALLYLRQQIIKTRNSPTSDNQKKLDEAEKNFFLQLEKICKMERFLRKTEMTSTTEGVRFFQSMPLLDKNHTSPLYIPWGSRMEKLLRDTQKTYFAEDKTF